jgi:proteic killer suppression protein
MLALAISGKPVAFVGNREIARTISTAVDSLQLALTIRVTYHILQAMIRSFADRASERFFRDGVCPARWRAFEAVAARKLDMVDAAVRLEDLRSPPGNQLEALRGDRRGQYSIRINRQWRVCFRWTPEGPEGVEIVDYH